MLRKTVSPCRWRGLEDDLAWGNNASSLACRCDEGDNEETIADADLWLLCLGRHRQQRQIRLFICVEYSPRWSLFCFYSLISFRQHRDWDNIACTGFFLKFLFLSIDPLKFTANVIVIYDLPEVRGLRNKNVFITQEMLRCSSHTRAFWCWIWNIDPACGS